MRGRLVLAGLALLLMVPVTALAAGGRQQLADGLREGGGVLTYHEDTGFARFYSAGPGGDSGLPLRLGQSPESIAAAFLDTYGPVFGIDDPASQLELGSARSAGSRSILRYQQVLDGVPVVAGELVVQVTGGKVATVNGEVAPLKAVPTQPSVSAGTAASLAIEAIAKARDVAPETLTSSTPELAIYYPPLLGIGPDRALLVWQTEVSSPSSLDLREYTLVDATSGAIALQFNRNQQALQRAIHDAGGGAALPGTLVRSEGDGATGDSQVDLAYEFAGDFYDFYASHFGRDGFDNAGSTLTTSVYYGDSCPNAFWNGTQTAFCAGMVVDDVVGHEFTHAVTDYESNLFYFYQSGALNEGLSDIFGELIDLSNGSGDDDATTRWQMGEGCALGVIRDLEDPTIYGHPDRLTSPYWYCASPSSDNGGVHANATVLGKAAYLIADGDSFNGFTVTGLGLDKMAAIFYELQTNLLTSGSDYGDVYYLLPQACLNLVGSNGITSPDCDQVRAAVAATEMDQPPAACGIAEAPYCPEGMACSDLFYDDLEAPASGNWTSYAIYGGNVWYYPQNPNPYLELYYATSGTHHMFGDDVATKRDAAIAMTADVALPAGTAAYLRFNHSYWFEYSGSSYYDGGVVEYSTDGGGTWLDAGPLFDANGYGGTLSSSYGNPLGGRAAFVACSLGYTSSRLNLSSLAGQSVRFRFRIGTDSVYASYGWFIDDIRVYAAYSATPSPTATPTATATATATATPTATPTATATPVSFGVSINDGALYTNSTDVVLSLSAPADYGEMQISNDGGFAAAIWESFSTSRSWQLSSYGSSVVPRTVYVRFRNAWGAEHWCSDDIILDVAAPKGSVRVITSGDGLSTPARVTLQLSAADEASGIASMLIADDASFTGAIWQSFVASTTWVGSSGTVYVRFRDGAGNESETYAAGYVATPRLFVPLLQ